MRRSRSNVSPGLRVKLKVGGLSAQPGGALSFTIPPIVCRYGLVNRSLRVCGSKLDSSSGRSSATLARSWLISPSTSTMNIGVAVSDRRTLPSLRSSPVRNSGVTLPQRSTLAGRSPRLSASLRTSPPPPRSHSARTPCPPRSKRNASTSSAIGTLPR